MINLSNILILDIVGLFILLAGFIIGLGAVTVIDIHGFLGRKSSYWTVATTRTHKVTKPLIWCGIFLVIIGGLIFYRNDTVSVIPFIHLGCSILLILNGLFLSFRVSPFLLQREKDSRDGELLPTSWQTKIIFSLILSDILWWGSLLLLVIYVLQK
ncbi:MAG: hypothetical protein K9L98_01845 [Candidatus Pacebacteria bacterium]|nr:hypothetical protein [Candidatus Paceibacterota bacterium]MCF7862730.1 hypothetical protein [Candidatus Paceibacterota bacterium]